MIGKELSGIYLNHDESAAPLTTGDELPVELGDVLPELGIQKEIGGKGVGEDEKIEDRKREDEDEEGEESGERRDESLEVRDESGEREDEEREDGGEESGEKGEESGEKRDEGGSRRKGILGTRRRKLAFFTPFVAIAGIWAISNFHPVSSGDNAPPQTPTPTDIPNFVPPATSQEVVRAIVLPEKKLNPLDLPGVLEGFTVYSPSLSEGKNVISEKEWIACYGLLPTFQSASQQMVIDGKNIGDDILRGLGPHAGERVLASAAMIIGDCANDSTYSGRPPFYHGPVGLPVGTINKYKLRKEDVYDPAIASRFFLLEFGSWYQSLDRDPMWSSYSPETKMQLSLKLMFNDTRMSTNDITWTELYALQMSSFTKRVSLEGYVV